jgi:two-component system, OmpR family, phosphate regulon response regulator PhoB
LAVSSDQVDIGGTVTRRRLLVVDDEETIRQTLFDGFASAGPYDVVSASQASTALELFEREPPDLVLVDLGLPDMGGLDLVRAIRHRGQVPVIVLTGRNDEASRVLGLELGADDYVTKPFSFLELAARVKAVLRRTLPRPIGSRLQFDELTIDLLAREVSVHGGVVAMTAREFDLLVFLASHSRQVFTNAQLLEQVWGIDPGWQGPGTVKEHIHRLRAKLESGPATRHRIITVHRLGYRFDP